MTANHYVFQTDLVKARIRKLRTALDNKALEWVNAKVSANFSLPLLGQKPSTNLTIELPILGSRLNRKFLGKYEALFNNPIEQPVPTWEAFDWLIEDYGYLCEEEKCYDRLYAKELKDSYQEEAPEAVKRNGHFYDCPRRYKWNPEALIDSKEYNWPIIPGTFTTPMECAIAYNAFFEAHKTHTDPVCFWAVVFCKYLAYFCQDHKVCCNVNEFSSLRPEFHIWLKVEYRCSRWHKMLEVMSITQFFLGPHTAFINEFS